MTLAKIKHGLTGLFVADMFGVSNTLVTKIFATLTAFLGRKMEYPITSRQTVTSQKEIIEHKGVVH